jgi:small conductance mechanosensitive channel
MIKPRPLLAALLLALLLVVLQPLGLRAQLVPMQTENYQERVVDAGSLELGKVRVLGIPVITVAAPSKGDAKKLSAADRARVIEGNLNLLVSPASACSASEKTAEQFLDMFMNGDISNLACDRYMLGLQGAPKDLKVVVNQHVNGAYQLSAKLPGRSQLLPLVTVTEVDAILNGVTPSELAEIWRKKLEERLIYARLLLQPKVQQSILLRVMLLELLFSGFVLLLLRRWSRDRERGAIVRSRVLLALLLLMVVLMLATALFAVPGELPLALAVLYQPFSLVLKAGLLALLAALLRFMLTLLLAQWASSRHVAPAGRERREQRHRSLDYISKRLINLFCSVIWAGWVLVDVPGVREAGSQVVLAGGAVLGALALVFQSLLQDFASGLVILVDDRYAIGDWVNVGIHSGEVIDLDVLSTKLRTLDQRWVVLPNSACTLVVNHTKLQSGMLVDLQLAHGCDLNHAFGEISEELAQFYRDPQWHEQLMGPPLLRGLTASDPLGLTVSTLLFTHAGDQWSCERELRRRLIERLRLERIPLAHAPAVIGSSQIQLS